MLNVTEVLSQIELSASLLEIVTAGVALELTVTTALPVISTAAAAHFVSDRDVIKKVEVVVGVTDKVYGLLDTDTGLDASV